MNPDGRTMRRYERELKDTVLSALERLQGDLFGSVNEGTVVTVPAKLDDPRILHPFRDAIVAGVQRIAIAGAEFGREQVERHVFGVKVLATKKGPLEIDWQLANNAAAEWALEYGYDLVRGITDTTRRRLQTEIDRFITNAETLPELTGRLDDLFGPVRAEAISSTETTRAYAQGNLASWRESKVIEGKTWNTANDEIVCPICAPLNGVTVRLDEAFPGGFDGPPAHPRDRCWLTPAVIVEEERVSTPEPETIVVESAPLNPAGVPVSGALKGPNSGKYAQKYNETLSAIDSVHGDGDLPTIPIKTNSSMQALGEFRFARRFERGRGFYASPIEIRINGKGDHHQLTLAHEVGHFLSRGAIDPASAGNRERVLSEWRAAVEGSTAIQELQKRYDNPDDYRAERTFFSPMSGKYLTYTTAPDRGHLRYLMDEEEMWARSYAQYVATKSGNQAMLDQLDEARRDNIYGHSQWADDDFAPISAVIDKLFVSLGWLR